MTKKIITQLAVAYAYHQAAEQGYGGLLPAPRSVGYGVGLAFALFTMEMAASLFTYQAQQRASVIGFMMRASVGLGVTTSLTIVNRHDLAKVDVSDRLNSLISGDCPGSLGWR